MDVNIDQSWQILMQDAFSSSYFVNLLNYLRTEYQNHLIYPKQNDLFNALNHCPIENVKVVILGQDPYHGPGQAHGLSFSVPEGIPFPPSLRNIFKELKRDLGTEVPSHGNLTHWAKQGVLLLNATLTVRAHQAGSHQKKGWEQFTDDVIRVINRHQENVVFMLWGGYAQKKATLITDEKHLKLFAPHPSPLSAHKGFIGCGHFSKANDYLKMNGLKQINW